MFITKTPRLSLSSVLIIFLQARNVKLAYMGQFLLGELFLTHPTKILGGLWPTRLTLQHPHGIYVVRQILSTAR